jgi:hypothetical protein
VDRAIKASIDLAMPVVGRGVDKALPLGDPGIVDEDVEAAEILDDGLDHRRDGGKIRYVGPIGFGFDACAGELAGELFRFGAGTAVIDGDAGALGGEDLRDFAADTARRTRHQGDLAFQSQIHGRSLTFWFWFWLLLLPLRSAGIAAPASPAAR